jgi:hypothetical protein
MNGLNFVEPRTILVGIDHYRQLLHSRRIVVHIVEITTVTAHRFVIQLLQFNPPESTRGHFRHRPEVRDDAD